MGIKFRVSTEALRRDKDSLREQLQQLERALEGLAVSMEALDQTWEGTARGFHMSQYRSDRQSMEKLCETLEEFVGLLEYAEARYQDSEDKAKEVVALLEV